MDWLMGFPAAFGMEPALRLDDLYWGMTQIFKLIEVAWG